MKTLIVHLLLLLSIHAFTQTKDLPIEALKGNDPAKPLLLYISGDGGWNKFSTSLVNTLNKQGYPVISLNARSYFWTKKKPQQAADDISRALDKYMKEWKTATIVLIGYSFGADVAPFVQTHFRGSLAENIKHTILMSPSRK